MSRLNSVVTLVSGFAAAALPLLSSSAEAQVTYYTRSQIEVCSNQAQNTAVGAIAGGAIGALAGAVLSGGRAGGTIAGAVGGGVLGGLLGDSASCQDQVTYIRNVDDFLYQREYWQPIDTPNSHLLVLRSGYGPHGEVCRTFHSEMLLPNGAWVTDESTACYDRGSRMWRYGYPTDYILNPTWMNPRPIFVHEFHPRPLPRPYDSGREFGRGEYGPPPGPSFGVGVVVDLRDHDHRDDHGFDRHDDRHDDHGFDRHDEHHDDHGFNDDHGRRDDDRPHGPGVSH